jgi:hypothetical protein
MRSGASSVAHAQQTVQTQKALNINIANSSAAQHARSSQQTISVQSQSLDPNRGQNIDFTA